jgi:hypothetical protein
VSYADFAGHVRRFNQESVLDAVVAATFASPAAELHPDRPVPRMAGTAAVGAVVHLPAIAVEEGRDRSSMSGILADSSYRLVPA